MNQINQGEISQFLKLLPAIYRESGDFLNDFLKGFETILSENVFSVMPGDPPVPIEEIIDKIEDYFDPHQTPAQFLSWLGSWLEFPIKRGEDYNHVLDIQERDNYFAQIPPLSQSEARSSWNRDLLANIFNLYLKRSTRTGLEQYLEFYKNNASYYCSIDENTKNIIKIKDFFAYNIYEFLWPFVISDVQERNYQNRGLYVGQTTVVHERDPNYFWIDISIKHSNLDLIQKIQRDLISLINEEKPAHNYFYLTATVDTMMVGQDNLLGYNTYSGGRYEIN